MTLGRSELSGSSSVKEHTSTHPSRFLGSYRAGEGFTELNSSAMWAVMLSALHKEAG